MKNGSKGRVAVRALTGAALVTMATGMAGAMGCLSRPIEPVEPRTTSTIVERLTQSAVDKIDLLLAIDNSRSMADKQAILALAVPDLVDGLVNPVCIDPMGNPVDAASQPTDPLADCPEGSERDFEPVLDIHIGVISSSLGDYGAGSCPASAAGANNDDKARLLDRDGAGGQVDTYDCNGATNCGFLAWDPEQSETPPGIPDSNALTAQVTDLVTGAGQSGCGYEAQLESWYRFLIDPEPALEITLNADPIKTGVDEVVLQQRKDFLRPDSLLAIVMLTDENDCSVRQRSGYSLVLQTGNGDRMPAARSECASDPLNECCLSCAQDAGSCPAEAGCDKSTKLAAEADHINQRCWDQKRRFGIDFLYPTRRYVNALTQTQIDPTKDDLAVENTDKAVLNPIFVDLNPDDDNQGSRDPSLVFFAGIVGVPWQSIARRDEAGAPDLLNGLDAEGNPVGGFRSFDELQQNGIWEQILGDPENYVPPSDPLMVESEVPRSGTTPATGEALAPPSDLLGNSINGNEWTISARNDLQYACIFDLLDPRDCSDTAQNSSCDCTNNDATADNPLCAPNPMDPVDPTNRTLQVRAKGYPGIRHLAVLNGVQSQGIVASVCPAQVTDQGAAATDFGYRPAIGAIIERLKLALGGQCLPQTLTPDPATGRVPCLVLEARNSNGSKDCNIPGRRAVQPDNQNAADEVLNDDFAETLGWDVVCEIEQLVDDAGASCQNDLDVAEDVDGWCYVDATTVPQTGNAEIVADCPANEQRLIRFVGKGEVQAGATLFITCSGDTSAAE